MMQRGVVPAVKEGVQNERVGYAVCAVGTGLVIWVTNLINIKESPRYHHTTTPIGMGFVQFTACIGFKAWMYTWFWPVVWMRIGFDAVTGNESAFRSHFIPFSKYFSYK